MVCIRLSLSCTEKSTLSHHSKPPLQQSQSKHTRLNLGSNERGRSRRVDLVVAVRRSNDNSVVTDVITVMAENNRPGYRNQAVTLITICIAESHNYSSKNQHSASMNHFWKRQLTSTNPRRIRSTQPLRSSVHQLRTLAVSRHDNLCRRTPRRRLPNQIEHGCGAR
jgi:hypothetical protein